MRDVGIASVSGPILGVGERHVRLAPCDRRLTLRDQPCVDLAKGF